MKKATAASGRAAMHLRAVVLALATCATLASSAEADDYPSRPIRLIVPFPAGGPVDVMGRLIAQQLSASLGQQVLVDNRPGAGSTIAGRAAASADPDGYTLMMGSAAPLAIAPTLYPNAGYDPTTAFAPVAFFSSVPYVMIGRPQSVLRTIPQLLAFAKANPGKLNFGVPNGAPPHMLAAWFRNVTGTDIVIVPYRGAATVITDLIGGQVDLGFETTSVTLNHVRDGTVKGLGIAAEARSPEIPQVPTLIQAGVNDFVASSWTGIVAPAQAPRPIIERLNKEVNEAVKSATMQARFRQIGAVADPGPPERFAAFIARERPKWISMVKLSGVQPE